MIKVIAKNFVKENKVTEVLELLRQLVEKTVNEKGCIKYEMYQDLKDPKVLIMLEEWETPEDLNNHVSSENFKKVVSKMSECMDKESEMSVCKKLL